MQRNKPTKDQLRAYLNRELKNPDMGQILGTSTKHGTQACVLKHLKNLFVKGQLTII